MHSRNFSDMLPGRENLQCFSCCKVQYSENFLKQIHIVRCCLCNGCICATTFTSCWEGRLNPVVERQSFGKRGGEEAGQDASKGQVQWSKQIRTSLSQEVPILDRKASLNIQNPKVIDWFKFSPIFYAFSNTVFPKAFKYAFKHVFRNRKEKEGHNCRDAQIQF